MISVVEAFNIVLNNCPPSDLEIVNFDNCQGKILAENIYADRDFPPFDRVTMDGIAIKYESFSNGQRSFQISGIAAAGAPKQKLNIGDQCIEVMTGAILPENTNVVIRYEDISINEGIAKIEVESLKFRQNVHAQGSDRKMNSLLISKGKKILAPELGVLSTVGKSNVTVYKSPKIAIISSGDELVDITVHPLPHQIRKSNNYSIRAALSYFSDDIVLYHLPDNAEIIEKQIKTILSENDVLILSGGVSKGKFDFIPDALENCGVKKLFHKVKQRPGKPFWFGTNDQNKVVFALPGNPVSSFMCTMKYVVSWLNKHLNIAESKFYGALTTDITFKPDLTYYAQVKLEMDENAFLYAVPIEGNGSGDLANLSDADAFIELPKGKDVYKAGEVYEIFRFRD